jgi:hypothetical protein
MTVIVPEYSIEKDIYYDDVECMNTEYVHDKEHN